MAVNLTAPDPSALLAIKGVRLGVTEAGVRKANRKDLLLMTLAAGTRIAAGPPVGRPPYKIGSMSTAAVEQSGVLHKQPATSAAADAATGR